MENSITESLISGTWYIPCAIMLLAYAFLCVEKINHALVTILGALLMVLTGSLTQAEAFGGMDPNTIILILGMMILVHTMEKSGIFQYIAIWSAKKTKANPRILLAVMIAITAFLSGLLDNVTTVLLMAPMVILIAKRLNVAPYPYLYGIIFASNIGGTATLIGDPPNILIGSAKNFSFVDFLNYAGPPALVILLANIVFMDLLYGRKLKASQAKRASIMTFDEKASITDMGLVYKSLFVVIGVIIGFVCAHPLGIDSGTVALTGAALLLLLQAVHMPHHHQNKHMETTLGHGVDWSTIFFFCGLFVIVAGVEKTGLLNYLGQQLLTMTDFDPEKTTYTVLWSSAILSTLINNVPFVATMIPLIDNVTPGLGGPEAAFPLWWAMALGACLGGNGTIIGASANVMTVQIAKKHGYHHITFWTFLKYGMMSVFFSTIISHIYLWLRFF